MKRTNVLTVSVLTWFATLVTSCAGTATTLLAAPGDQSTEKVWHFDGDKTGQIATGFTGEVGQWKLVEDGTAPSKPRVLAQLAKNSGPIFNVALATDTNYADIDISLKFKAVAGRGDHGGGPVWRAQDAKNYYIARYGPLEDNYRVYKVVKGRRHQLQSADVNHVPGWQALRVTMPGDHIECYYDGKKYLDVKDQTFNNPGSVGLWTKADAQTYFDDLRVSAPTKSALVWHSWYTKTPPTLTASWKRCGRAPSHSLLLCAKPSGATTRGRLRVGRFTPMTPSTSWRSGPMRPRAICAIPTSGTLKDRLTSVRRSPTTSWPWSSL
jgi:hypothetical protein